jgi:hypothetical protein
MKPSALLIGLLAGLASALLFAGLVTQSSGAVGLALVAPVPIMLASLGWGSASGFVAALAAFGAVAAAAGTLNAGFSVLIPVALPAAILGHIAGLARPIEGPHGQPQLDWFPVRRILLSATLLAAAACIALGALIGFDRDELAPLVAEALTQQGASGDLQSAQVQEIAHFVVGAIPFVQPAFLLLTLVICLYVSAAIARTSGRLQRPRDDIPATATLPRNALTLFAVALAASFLGGTAGTVAAVLVGALALAFTFVGLAALHRRTRGRPSRVLILFTTYAAIALLSFPLLAFLVLGLFETAKPPASPADA